MMFVRFTRSKNVVRHCLQGTLARHCFESESHLLFPYTGTKSLLLILVFYEIVLNKNKVKSHLVTNTHHKSIFQIFAIIYETCKLYKTLSSNLNRAMLMKSESNVLQVSGLVLVCCHNRVCRSDCSKSFSTTFCYAKTIGFVTKQVLETSQQQKAFFFF